MPPPTPEMHCIENRLSSFSSSSASTSLAWPYDASTSFPSPAALSQAGFYFAPRQDDEDNCICFFCDKNLGGWEEGDDPDVEHEKRKGCAWGLAVCGVRLGRRRKGTFRTEDDLPQSTSLTKARIQTYGKHWPHKARKAFIPSSVKKLAEAGFTYNPSINAPDGVTCFYCDCSVEDWEAKDDPWEYHVSKSPRCIFFSAQVGTVMDGPLVKSVSGSNVLGASSSGNLGDVAASIKRPARSAKSKSTKRAPLPAPSDPTPSTSSDPTAPAASTSTFTAPARQTRTRQPSAAISTLESELEGLSMGEGGKSVRGKVGGRGGRGRVRGGRGKGKGRGGVVQDSGPSEAEQTEPEAEDEAAAMDIDIDVPLPEPKEEEEVEEPKQKSTRAKPSKPKRATRARTTVVQRDEVEEVMPLPAPAPAPGRRTRAGSRQPQPEVEVEVVESGGEEVQELPEVPAEEEVPMEEEEEEEEEEEVVVVKKGGKGKRATGLGKGKKSVAPPKKGKAGKPGGKGKGDPKSGTEREEVEQTTRSVSASTSTSASASMATSGAEEGMETTDAEEEGISSTRTIRGLPGKTGGQGKDKEVQDFSDQVEQGAMEARGVIQTLGSSARTPTGAGKVAQQAKGPEEGESNPFLVAAPARGEGEEEYVLSEEQKGMTVAEFVRAEMMMRYEEVKGRGEDMIREWERRAGEQRGVIERL